MAEVTFRVMPIMEEGMCAIPLPFDPREIFGKARAPVVVTLGAHSYRSTVAIMGGRTFVPLRKSHQQACGLDLHREVEVTLALDEAPRVVEVPRGLAILLEGDPDLKAAWSALSYTHQREHVEALEGAKRPETRMRRLEQLVLRLRGVLQTP